MGIVGGCCLKNKNRYLKMEQNYRKATYRVCHEESTTPPEIFHTLIYIIINQAYLYPISNAYGDDKTRKMEPSCCSMHCSCCTWCVSLHCTSPNLRQRSSQAVRRRLHYVKHFET